MVEIELGAGHAYLGETELSNLLARSLLAASSSNEVEQLPVLAIATKLCTVTVMLQHEFVRKQRKLAFRVERPGYARPA